MDHYWLMSLLTLHRDIKVCCINYYLYRYINHPGTGQTRHPNRIYDESGMKRTILTYEKTLALQNFFPSAAEKLKGKVYAQSVNTLYRNQVKFNDDSYRKLRNYMKRYAYAYYAHYDSSVSVKIKMLIKHILLIFHIHK
jgi:hypothetical protein